ncbi:MAG TPA: lytic murein transglycosylase B [Gammaproteobacteria bacterium]|nr:lytic murein transglycosylase B [Gammaproteobacteria bacterium]
MHRTRPVRRHAAAARVAAILLPTALVLAAFARPALAQPPFFQSAAFHKFVDRMVQQHGFQTSRLEHWFRHVHYRKDILKSIRQPAEKLPWYRYRRIFVTSSRIAEGVRFWQRNRALLQRARKEYGVPPQIIVAILGVETRYGSHSGSYPVIDTLATLGFDYPPRGAYFRRELEQFLLMARAQDLDPDDIRGSYAGAMGMPQFMPSSYREYAVDFNGDGRKDLWHTHADAIGSIANYFARHGWRKGQPIVLRARPGSADAGKLSDGPLKPHTTVAALRKAGIEIDADGDGKDPAFLFALTEKQGKGYWVGLHNFYVITRYNHSPLYAMAVYQLSRAIRKQYQAGENAA